ncbi:hypothetical protein Hte_003129 [Hypoxylon texense]
MAKNEAQNDAIAVAPMEDERVINHIDRDHEIAAYANETAVHIDKETDKKLFWTVNKRILACMLGTYFCQSLDKGTLGFASVMNIKQDANLKGQEYSWLGTILYMGVLVGEYPTTRLLQRFPVAKYLSINVFCWGVVIACSAAAHNFGSLMAVRFLLGIFESCVQPSFIIMTSMWYTKREQSVLTSLWYCMTGVQLMVGGLIAYGASHYEGHSIKSWQLLFLVLGCATCAWAVFIGWWLPDSPMKAKCFDEDQKRMMIERVRANETGIQNKTYKRYQMLEALQDPVIWCYVMLQITSTLVIGGLGVFSNLIVAAFGFSYLQTQLLNIAQGGVTIIVMIGGAWLATWTKQTAIVMHIFQDSDAPRYQKGFTAHFCLYVLFNLFLVLLRVLLAKRNAAKRRDASAAAASEQDASSHDDEKIGHAHAFDDLTDKENPDFRYEL